MKKLNDADKIMWDFYKEQDKQDSLFKHMNYYDMFLYMHYNNWWKEELNKNKKKEYDDIYKKARKTFKKEQQARFETLENYFLAITYAEHYSMVTQLVTAIFADLVACGLWNIGMKDTGFKESNSTYLNFMNIADIYYDKWLEALSNEELVNNKLLPFYESLSGVNYTNVNRMDIGKIIYRNIHLYYNYLINELKLSDSDIFAFNESEQMFGPGMRNANNAPMFGNPNNDNIFVALDSFVNNCVNNQNIEKVISITKYNSNVARGNQYVTFKSNKDFLLRIIDIGLGATSFNLTKENVAYFETSTSSGIPNAYRIGYYKWTE